MKITSKGQVTLPKDIREHMGLHPGMAVYFLEKNGQILLIKGEKGNPWERYRGILRSRHWKRTDKFINVLRGKA